jgi:hypothetical protein
MRWYDSLQILTSEHADASEKYSTLNVMQVLEQSDSHFLSKNSDSELEKSPFSLNASFGLVLLPSGNNASAFKDESYWQLGV